jgi:Ca2+-binding RTX toxin-like protein
MPVNFTFNAPGTYTIEDDGIRGNGVSVIRNAAGAVIFTIVHPADAVNLNVSTAGVNLIFNVLDTFGTAVVTVGDLASAAQSPDSIVVHQLSSTNLVTLVSNGSITEGGNDAAADLAVNSLVMSAVTGIGTAANALETQTVVIEAETSTGGINVANFGNLQIGGLSAAVDGLDVVNSGNLTLSTVGFIVLSDLTGPEIVHGGDLSGNVTLTAIGANADLFSTVDRPSVTAAGGGITLTAGRDIAFGTSGTNFNNDVLATTFVDIHAGRDFVLDGTSNVRTSAFGGVVGGPIDIQVGRNILLTNTNGGLQSIEAFLGNLTLTTGPNGSYFQSAAFSNALSSSADIIINADNVSLNEGGINTTGVGQILIRPATPGRAIDIGSGTDLFAALSLSEAELDRLFTLNIGIGDENSGPVEFTAPISPNLFPTGLTVRSGTEILVRSSITLDGPLTLQAGNDIFFTAAGSLTTTNGGFTGIVDAAQDDGGVGGTARLNGTINVTGGIMLFGNVDADNLIGDAVANSLFGFGGNDVLNGNAGNDNLDGGPGSDTLFGGPGDDNFVVDNSGDQVVEAVGEGFDTIFTTVNYRTSANVERISTFDIASTAALNLTGNGLANEIIGNAGVNILDGDGGADTMKGLGGDDVYLVDNAGDVAFELAGEGTDIVYATVSYTLGANVERLAVNGSATTFAINLTGNGLNNELVGNDGVNLLDGGGGADIMTGFGNNDVYVVDNAGDVVNEAAGGGTDIIFTTVSYTLGANVERLGALNPASTNAINFIGNGLANEISGNDGANVLNGGLGADMLIGRAGADAFFFTSALGGGNIDMIADFAPGVDKLALDDAVFAGLPTGALAAGAFRTGTAAGDADDRIIYDPATGALFFDADGNGAGAQVQFATLSSGLALGAGDFVVV